MGDKPVQKRHTVADYTEAITKSHGLVAIAARRLGVSRQAVYNMVNRHPEVNEAMTDAREELLDMAEANLFAAIAKGNLKISCWVLERLGKHWGYTRQFIMTPSGPTVQEISEMSNEELARQLKKYGLN